ncbi:Uncharacterized protein Rs2_04408 [Raphanus sativus]|nr:Uncharacterized protein Rs2_04408 [Raphanus sativus]
MSSPPPPLSLTSSPPILLTSSSLLSPFEDTTPPLPFYIPTWCRVASIGWHSDDNTQYMKQKDFSAVCYLSSYGKDFKGGLLRYQSGETATVVPSAADVIMYTADDRNIHSVDEVCLPLLKVENLPDYTQQRMN